MSLSQGERIERRVRTLMIWVSAAILTVAVVSIFEFRNSASEGRTIVGLVLPVARDDSAWSRRHYYGLAAACERMGCDLLVQEHIPVTRDDCRKAVEFLAEKGAKKIFLPSGGYLNQVDDMVRRYPRIDFYANAVGTRMPHVTSYAMRYYELYYLSGMLAGMRTRTGAVGFIAPIDSPETDRNINAFTLGALRVNGDARVLAYWTGRWVDPDAERDAVYRARRDHADVIAYQLDGSTVPDTAERLGIDYIACYEADDAHNHALGALRMDWETAYMDLLQSFFYTDESGASIYWPPMGRGTMSLKLTDSATEEESRRIEEAALEILNGRAVFSGEIYDNQGVERSRPGECISEQYLQSEMNWLARGVDSIDGR